MDPQEQARRPVAQLTPGRARAPRAARGWALVVVLLALAIVAFLARDALTAWLGRGPSAARPAAPLAGADAPAPLPATPLERAGSVEATVQQQADERRRSIDGAAR